MGNTEQISNVSTDIPDCVDTTNVTNNQDITTYDTLPPGFGLTDLKEKKVKKCRNKNGQIIDVAPTQIPTPVPTPLSTPYEPSPVSTSEYNKTKPNPLPKSEVDLPACVDTTNGST